MASRIEHAAQVIQIDGRMVTVTMTVEAACEGCKMRSMCNKDSMNEKIVSVYTDGHVPYSVGEQVVISISTAMGVKAAMWVYAIPFLLIMTTLVGLIEIGTTELVAGLASLSIVGLYYFVLYLLRRAIEREIVFELHKK